MINHTVMIFFSLITILTRLPIDRQRIGICKMQSILCVGKGGAGKGGAATVASGGCAVGWDRRAVARQAPGFRVRSGPEGVGEGVLPGLGAGQHADHSVDAQRRELRDALRAAPVALPEARGDGRHLVARALVRKRPNDLIMSTSSWAIPQPLPSLGCPDMATANLLRNMHCQ